MLYIVNDNVDPYFNLALEEYLLKEFAQECFMLWRNSPCIVVGKNQNTLGEINLDYVRKHHIKVVRRLSGGGAVYHDLGNLNFTFIVNDLHNSFCDFSKFTSPIIAVLRKLGVRAELSGRNDLCISGQKFSGNAQYKYKDRLLHHGTILFSAVIPDISAALRVNPSKFEGKGVKSVAGRITNIQSYLAEPVTIEELKTMIVDEVKTDRDHYEIYRLTSMDIERVNESARGKYAAWDWNYGISPEYNLQNKARFQGGSVEVFLNVKTGVIRNARIFGDFFGKSDVCQIEQALVGVRHERKAISDSLAGFCFEEYLAGVTLMEFLDLLF